MSPTRGMTIFVWGGENSQLHAWTMNPTGALTYLAQGRETASVNVTNSPGGMPGGFCSLSSDANKVGTAVLWCSIPYGDGNATVTNGRLLAYDPEYLIANADGSKTLRVLGTRSNGMFSTSSTNFFHLWYGMEGSAFRTITAALTFTRLRRSQLDRSDPLQVSSLWVCDVLIPRGINVHKAGVVQWQNVRFPK